MHTAIAQHEAEFHNHGEQVDEPYPQLSEHPLRTGVAKITDTGGDGTYTVTEQVWTGSAWTNGTAPGQYVNASARDYNDSEDGAADDLVFFWEQYTEKGVIELIVAVGLGDEKVAATSGQAANHLDQVLVTGDQWTVFTVSGATLEGKHGLPDYDSTSYVEYVAGATSYTVVTQGTAATGTFTKIRCDYKGHICAVYRSDDSSWRRFPEFWYAA